MNTNAFLGIDVSKGYADFSLLNVQSETLESNFQLLDTKDDRKKLLQLIDKWEASGIQNLYCGVESTGGYENNWYAFLKELGKTRNVFTSRLNAKAIKAVSDASLRRTITDSVSARSIAYYLIKFPEKVDYGLNYVSPVEFTEGRNQLTALKMFIKQKTQLSNQLEKWLYGNFSEMLIYCRNGMPIWLLRMLEKYPSPTKVISAKNKLEKIKGINKEKAKAIVEKAKQSSHVVSPIMTELISNHAKEILHKIALIQKTEDLIVDEHKDKKEIELISSIIGIGVRSAVKIYLEIEDVNRFKSTKKLASYFGVHPIFKQSGDGTWGNHMSKKGRPEMRSILYMCALSGVRHNPLLKSVYSRARENGMKHKQAMGVAMHKLLRNIYGVLKSDKKFDPEIDRRNQRNSIEKQNEYEMRKKEAKKIERKEILRYQKNINDAPISGRNAVKRKKQLASQASLTEENTGLPTAGTKI